MELAVGFKSSAAEEVAKAAKGAKVVKCFNTIFADVVSNPSFEGDKPAVFMASEHEDAKQAARHLAESIGFDAVDAGPLKNARYLEPMAMLMIDLGYARGFGSGIAFKLLRR